MQIDGELDQVRSELRRLGYLNHGLERFLLQDALRPRQPLRTLLRLTGKVGLLAGSVLAMLFAIALAAANGGLTATPLDLVALFFHLFPPISLLSAVAFLVLSSLLLLVLRLRPVRRIETLSFAAAVAAGAAGHLVGLADAASVLREGATAVRTPELLVVGLLLPLAVYLLIKLVDQGLLTLAIRFTDLPPRRRLFSRRWLGLAIVGAAAVLTVPSLLSAHRKPPQAPST
ncbi:MAG TPA: hypothetical protein VGE98_03330, partial [Thermoanaerobaculia bacterium]